MIDLDFLSNRKKDIHIQFENVKNEIVGMKKAVEEKKRQLSQLQGNYAECEKMTAHLADNLEPELAENLDGIGGPDEN